jgi:hypothetical protein
MMSEIIRLMKEKSKLEKEVDGYLASTKVDKAADYANRGRPFGKLSDDALTEKWIAAFEMMVEDIADAGKRAEESDYESEFRLRGREPPLEKVKALVVRFSSQVAALVAKWEIDDPKWHETMGGDIAAALKNFKTRRDKPQN